MFKKIFLFTLFSSSGWVFYLYQNHQLQKKLTSLKSTFQDQQSFTEPKNADQSQEIIAKECIPWPILIITVTVLIIAVVFLSVWTIKKRTKEKENIKILKTNINNLNIEINDLTTKNKELQEHLKAQSNNLKILNEEKNNNEDNLKNENERLFQQKRNLEQEKTVLFEKNRQVQLENERLKKQNNDYAEQLADFLVQNNSLKFENDDLRNNQEKKIKEWQTKYDADHKQELEELESKNNDLTIEIKKLEATNLNQLKKNYKTYGFYDELVLRSEKENRELKSQITKCQAENEELQQFLKNAEISKEIQENKINKYEKDNKKLCNDNRSLKIKMEELQQSLKKSDEDKNKFSNLYHEENRKTIELQKTVNDQKIKIQKIWSKYNNLKNRFIKKSIIIITKCINFSIVKTDKTEIKK